MLKKIKELADIEKLVFVTSAVMILLSVVYLFAYWISRDVKLAFGFIFIAFIAILVASAIVIAFFNTIAFDAVIAAAIISTIAPVAAAAVATIAPVAAVGVLVFFLLLAPVAVTEAGDYRGKYWKIFLIYLAEAGLLSAAFTLYVPYLAIAVLLAAVVALGVILLRKRSAPAPEKAERI